MAFPVLVRKVPTLSGSRTERKQMETCFDLPNKEGLITVRCGPQNRRLESPLIGQSERGRLPHCSECSRTALHKNTPSFVFEREIRGRSHLKGRQSLLNCSYL
jgi:hypothetical protein